MSEETKKLDGAEFGDWDMKDEKVQNMLFRGKTPEDINQKLHKLCSDCLCGTWARVTPEELSVRRINGGMTNQLYYCGLPDGVETEPNEPRELAVLLYAKKHFNFYECEEKDERMTDLIIGSLLSEKKIAPKVYGISPVGIIQEFIDARPFFDTEENDPSMVKELAQKLARIHSLNMPIKRKNRYFETINSWFVKFSEKHTKELLESKNLTYFLKVDLAEEIEFIKQCVTAMNVPTVFNHNDFRNSNILVRNKPTDDDDKMRICDYEYGAYGYRGQDFGWLFNMWGQTKFSFEAKFPSDEVLKQFFEFYVDECAKINGPDYLKDPRNSIDFLIKETKVFRLAFSIFMTVCFSQMDTEGFDHIEGQQDGFLKMMDVGLKIYLDLKDRFIKEKAIPEEAVERNNNQI